MATILASGASPAANYTSESTRGSETVSGFTAPAGTDALYFGVTFAARGDAGADISSIDWNGDNAAVEVAGVNGGSGSTRARFWKLPGALPGTGTVTATMSANAYALRLHVWAVGGVDLVDDIGMVVPQSGVGFAGPYTPEASDSLLLAAICGLDDDSVPSSGYAPGWVLDEEAGAYHGNDAASNYGGFFHKEGSAAGVQEDFDITFSDGGDKALVLMEVLTAEGMGGTDATASPSGIAVMGAVGNVGVGIDSVAKVAGASGVGAAGSATVDTGGDATIVVYGVSGIGSVGPATIFGWARTADASGNWSGEGEANDIWAAVPAASGEWS